MTSLDLAFTTVATLLALSARRSGTTGSYSSAGRPVARIVSFTAPSGGFSVALSATSIVTSGVLPPLPSTATRRYWPSVVSGRAVSSFLPSAARRAACPLLCPFCSVRSPPMRTTYAAEPPFWM